MFLENFKNALRSIFSNKVRSLLTVLGVVIGVSSVTILVALGQGLKNEMTQMVDDLGSNIIFVVSGNIDLEDTSQMQQANMANFLAGDILTLEDAESIRALDDVEQVVPLSLVAGSVRFGELIATPTLVGTTPNILDTLNVININQGRMFGSGDTGNVLVLNEAGAKRLFLGGNAVGAEVMIGEETFEVIGTLKNSESDNLFGGEFENMAFIPLDAATGLNDGVVKIMRMGVKATGSEGVEALTDEIDAALLANHGGHKDFTVITQDEMLGLFSQFLDLATVLVSAIAGISLLVGGIGIMNIMLVTVTERTREIGLRKAIGATKGAILIQFLIEAVMVTMVGGWIGLLIAIGGGIAVAVYSPLTPEISPTLVLIAVGLSTVVGVIFGLWPAMRAAAKDPIEALRYE